MSALDDGTTIPCGRINETEIKEACGRGPRGLQDSPVLGKWACTPSCPRQVSCSPLCETAYNPFVEGKMIFTQQKCAHFVVHVSLLRRSLSDLLTWPNFKRRDFSFVHYNFYSISFR